MHEVILDPLAPLLFRDPRPFGGDGQGAESLPFPLPPSIAGALRTVLGEQEGVDYRADGVRDRLLGLACAGPLLAETTASGGWSPLCPRPLDALYLGQEVVRLAPASAPEGAGCDLPGGLLPVQAPAAAREKPAEGPAFWRLEPMAAWLAGAGVERDPGLGRDPVPREVRTHVALAPGTLTAEEGRLFETDGLDFGPVADRDGRGRLRGPAPALAPLARFAEPLAPGLRTLGGERRLARITPVAGAWPAVPDQLVAAVAGGGGLRLTLATPVPFTRGWLPGWLREDGTGSPPPVPGLTLRLRAAAVGRWQPISGWDLVARDGRPGGAPRAVRRLAPAGSVYWFEVLAGTLDAAAVAALWLASVADAEQDRRDGLGLALPGAWTPPPFE